LRFCDQGEEVGAEICENDWTLLRTLSTVVVENGVLAASGVCRCVVKVRDVTGYKQCRGRERWQEREGKKKRECLC